MIRSTTSCRRLIIWLREVLQASNPLGHRHGRPQAATVVIGSHGGLEGFFRLMLPAGGHASELNPLKTAIRRTDADRRPHGVDGTIPSREFAVDEIGPLVNGRGRAVVSRDLAVPGKQLP